MGVNQRAVAALLSCWVLICVVIVETTAFEERQTLDAAVRDRGLRTRRPEHRNAYATMMYMGTPRDYEFYVATRVLIRSLRALHVDADVVVIASLDVPLRWVRSMEEEDGAKVVRVENVENPYKGQRNFNGRFKQTLNKLYAWALSDYDRVVMLDADNLFLQNTDELFQCGQFCAVFINPCIFHTGLFVLQPSMDVFRDMLHELELRRHNPDGADQGFLVSYFSDLLNQPLFHPPTDPSHLLKGHFRLPLGYQMDASYYYLRLRWNIPCGPNSVITFPGAVWLKPWYWWSWPVLPLGLSWHEQRRSTLGYAAEMPLALIQAAFYIGIIVITRLARPTITKLCYRRSERNHSAIQNALKLTAIISIVAAYVLPFFTIPQTIHPLMGWSLYLIGSLSLSSIAINALLLPTLSVLTPWLCITGSLLVMAFPLYQDGVVRALAVFGYAFCSAPFVWVSLVRVMSHLQLLIEKEALFPRLGESGMNSGFSKLY
ncbi:PREDICTED: putative glucuronosyltransferase PGSIP8 [Tarenaya hassleriana]|uniref:putative glucuronosyltransferase PGSIP8 n=1 Tax=Tarenaya hassleriana TaxID=28532 RepID=UPI00053C3EB5|nr:PREDICTED: putative glucuronosyltransferase PGSIP8 [Tarenaya hassleriana]